jgi:hypothetical protein
MKFIGNINEVITDEFIETCKKHAKIYKTYGRTPEQILEQTINGEAVEFLVIKKLSFKAVPFEISEYDAIGKSGEKIEIKHTIKNEKWWTYNPESYSHFLRNTHKIDKIILCYLNKESGDVFLKFETNANVFEKYSKQSNFNSSFYFNTLIAEKNGDCIIY